MGIKASITDNSKWLWRDVTVCFGNTADDRIGRLALVNGAVNGKKGTFFKSKNPSPDVGNDQTAAHQLIFNTGGVFTYLNQVEIWKAWTDTSTCIEMAFYNFDQSYNWQGANGELKRPKDGIFNGKPFKYGTRSLYTGWIDAELAMIEKNARKWQANAVASYKKEFPLTANAVAKNFLKTLIGGTGPFSPASMKVPSGAGTPTKSKYGAWGDPSLPPPF